MKRIRGEKKQDNANNVIFLNAGDHFQGTFWYTIKKSEVVSEFVSMMDHDVMGIY